MKNLDDGFYTSQTQSFTELMLKWHLTRTELRAKYAQMTAGSI